MRPEVAHLRRHKNSAGRRCRGQSGQISARQLADKAKLIGCDLERLGDAARSGRARAFASKERGPLIAAGLLLGAYWQRRASC